MNTFVENASLAEEEPVSRGSRSTSQTEVVRFSGSHAETMRDTLAVEEPLELQLLHGPAESRQVKSISVTMRTPGHDFELVAGFLLTEGIVTDSAAIRGIAYVTGDGQVMRSVPQVRAALPYRPDRNIVRVELEPDVVVSMANLERNFYTTSSCGICGKASLLALRTICPAPAPNRIDIPADQICSLPDRLRAAQSDFDSTGGLHASGLFDLDGNLLSIREDVGRHNALDKLIGREFLADLTPLGNRILLLSGRASFELLQKAVMAGIQVVIAVGAPSSLAVTVAKEFNITLIGFLRGNRFNVYHGSEHIHATGQIRIAV